MKDFKKIILEIINKSKDCLYIAQGKCSTVQDNTECKDALTNCFDSYSLCYNICEQHLSNCHEQNCKLLCLDVMKQSKLCIEETKNCIEECSITEKRCLETVEKSSEVFQKHIELCNKLFEIYCS